MNDQSTDTKSLVVQGIFEAYRPSGLFRMWTEPDLLLEWWPPQAEVSAGEGGWYRFTWPEKDWLLRGRYLEWAPGKKLSFTWRWNHDPGELPERTVELTFEDLDGHTCLTIKQWPYLDTERDQTDRQGHIEGWIHYCMILAGLRVGDLLPAEDCAPISSRTGT